MAFRTANDDEATALIFTFGDRMGKALIDLIEIRTGEGESKNQNEVLLPPDYNSRDLFDLGDFIGKAVRVWQQNTGRYTHDKGLENYHYRQLYSLNLNSKQHAAAVKDWFYVSYGNVHRLIGTGPNRMHPDNVRGRILHVLGVSFNPRHWFVRMMSDLQQIVNNHYGCVIKEIRRDRVRPAIIGGIKKTGRVLP